MKYIFVLGRVLFSSIFIIKAIGQFCPMMIARASEKGVPMTELLYPFWGLLAIIGGLSILFGYKAKIGAWILVIFLLPITFVMHAFWIGESGMAVRMQMLCFWKNISLMGACLMIAYTGSGPCSLTKNK